MTQIYFVRHALPEHNWTEDRTRPLTSEGVKDSEEVAKALRDIPLSFAISSPYIRSMDTIRECAKEHNLTLHTDERFRERQRGKGGNVLELLHKRWEDIEFHEEGGESIGMVQRRNIEGLLEVLNSHSGEAILFGTHGTALSSMLRYFDPTFGREDFLRIVNYMPYILRMDFDGINYLGREELLVVDKGVTVYNQAYKK